MSETHEDQVASKAQTIGPLEKVLHAIERGDYADAAIRIAQWPQRCSGLSAYSQKWVFRSFDPNEQRDKNGRWIGSESKRSEDPKTAVSVAYCKIVKQLCIVEATSTLQTSDFGFQFWNAMNACMDRHGCLGVA